MAHPTTTAEPTTTVERDIGRYVTDGVRLYRLLELPDVAGDGLTGMEDCHSLDIVLVPAREVERHMRPVVPLADRRRADVHRTARPREETRCRSR